MLVESKKNKKAIRKNPLGRPKVTCTSPSNGGAKIQINTNSAIANLQQLLPKYNSQSSLKGLKTDIRRALGLPEKEGASDYGVFVIEDNGTSKECSIRISNHNANAGNYEGKESDTNISIKMRSRVNKNTFKPHKDIELMEYTYFDYLLMNVEQPIQKIILSIIEYLSNGIYNDKTGVALQNTSPQQTNNDTENNQEIKENRNMNKKQTIRINESQLRQIVTESVKRILKEEYGGYYYSISSCNKDLEALSCFEEEGGYSSPDEAYNEGLNQLKYYSDGMYVLKVYHFVTQSNGSHVGDYDSGYMAVNNHGKIKEF